MTWPNRSTVVAPIDVVGFPEYVEALDILQRLNTRLAAELRTPADLRAIAKRQREFEAAIRSGEHLASSGANKQFHMAIAQAGRNPFLAGFYDKMLDQGRRMLHLHFDYLERTNDGYLLTDEHDEMLGPIEARDVERADALAHAHRRQVRDNFIRFMTENHSLGVQLSHQAL